MSPDRNDSERRLEMETTCIITSMPAGNGQMLWFRLRVVHSRALVCLTKKLFSLAD